MSALVLSKEDKLAVMVAIRLRIEELKRPPRADIFTPDEIAEDAADLARLKAIAEAMEGAQVIVNTIARGVGTSS